MMYSSELHGIPSGREQEYLAGWQRSRAELQNIRKRAESQRQEVGQAARAHALEELLPLADHFTALAKHIPEDLENNSWAQGVLHIVREFERFLLEQGIEQINPTNQSFDPFLHEAVEQIAGEEENTVIEVVQVGYKFGDRVLRPAKVRVTK